MSVTSGITPDPVQTPSGTNTPILLGYAVQGIAIAFLGLLALTTNDGIRAEIVNALIFIATSNAFASGGNAVVKTITNASIQRTMLQTSARTNQIASQATSQAVQS